MSNFDDLILYLIPPLKSHKILAKKIIQYIKVLLTNIQIRLNQIIFELSKTNMAGGFKHNGDIYITSGHHRIVAATINGMQTGDYSILSKLINNGHFLTNNPSMYGYNSFSNFPTLWK